MFRIKFLCIDFVSTVCVNTHGANIFNRTNSSNNPYVLNFAWKQASVLPWLNWLKRCSYEAKIMSSNLIGSIICLFHFISFMLICFILLFFCYVYFSNCYKYRLYSWTRHPTREMQKAHADHKSNQSNPNNPAYKSASDNKANQMNPNNAAYAASRSHGTRGQ